MATLYLGDAEFARGSTRTNDITPKGPSVQVVSEQTRRIYLAKIPNTTLRLRVHSVMFISLLFKPRSHRASLRAGISLITRENEGSNGMQAEIRRQVPGAKCF